MYEQVSLFNGMLTEICDTKPEIGSKLIFHYNENEDYECIVQSHGGGDYFFVKFLDKEPGDIHPEVAKSNGWHLSIRGYKNNWEFSNDYQVKKSAEMPENENVLLKKHSRRVR